MYVFVKGSSWKDREWQPGDRIADGDVPADVIAVLKRSKAIKPAPPQAPVPASPPPAPPEA